MPNPNEAGPAVDALCCPDCGEATFTLSAVGYWGRCPNGHVFEAAKAGTCSPPSSPPDEPPRRMCANCHYPRDEHGTFGDRCPDGTGYFKIAAPRPPDEPSDPRESVRCKCGQMLSTHDDSTLECPDGSRSYFAVPAPDEPPKYQPTTTTRVDAVKGSRHCTLAGCTGNCGICPPSVPDTGDMGALEYADEPSVSDERVGDGGPKETKGAPHTSPTVSARTGPVEASVSVNDTPAPQSATYTRSDLEAVARMAIDATDDAWDDMVHPRLTPAEVVTRYLSQKGDEK